MLLKNKLIILGISALGIPMSFIMLLMFVNIKTTILESSMQQLQMIAHYKADKIERFFGDLQSYMQIVQSAFIIQTYLPVIKKDISDRENSEYLQAISRMDERFSVFFKAREELIDLMIVDLNGMIVYSGNKDQQQKKVGSRLPAAAQRAYTQGRSGIALSDIFASGDPAQGYAYGMYLGAPLYDRNAQLVGVAMFEINMEPMYTLIQERIGFEQTAETLIVQKKQGQPGSIDTREGAEGYLSLIHI